MSDIRERIAGLLDRHSVPGGAALLIALVGAVVWRVGSIELGQAIVFAAVVGGIIAIGDTERRHRDELRAIELAAEDEYLAARDLAKKVREIMLVTPLYRDVEAMHAWVDGTRANPGKKIPAPAVWSVDGIVERGVTGLEGAVRWGDLAQALRTHAELVSSNAGTYSRRLSLDAARAVESVTKAAELAAQSADYGAAASIALGDGRWAPNAERQPLQDRMREAREGFVLALQNLQGAVERLERWGEPPP